MRELGIKLLQDFRDEVYFSADERTTGMVPLHSFLPDKMMHNILDHFPILLRKAIIQPFINPADANNHTAAHQLLAPFIQDNQFMADRSHDMLCTLWTMHTAFDQLREEKRLEQKIKRDKKRAAEISAQLQINAIAREDPDETNVDEESVTSGGEN